MPEITPLPVSKSVLLRAVPGLTERSTEIPTFRDEVPDALEKY